MDENPYQSPEGWEPSRNRSPMRVLDHIWKAALCLTAVAGVGGLVLVLANLEVGLLVLQVSGGSGILALALIGLSLVVKAANLVLGRIIGE